MCMVVCLCSLPLAVSQTELELNGGGRWADRRASERRAYLLTHLPTYPLAHLPTYPLTHLPTYVGPDNTISAESIAEAVVKELASTTEAAFEAVRLE